MVALAENKRRIYIDICALCRPFDDQGFLRIRLETIAMHLILSKIRERHFHLFYSPVHERELRDLQDNFERIQAETFLHAYGSSAIIMVQSKSVRTRTEELIGVGMGLLDAAHAAFAEACNADLISCDDQFLKKCRKYLKVWAGLPENFCAKEGLQ
jgi:predicted nucleic acid-binding protein